MPKFGLLEKRKSNLLLGNLLIILLRELNLYTAISIFAEKAFGSSEHLFCIYSVSRNLFNKFDN